MIFSNKEKEHDEKNKMNEDVLRKSKEKIMKAPMNNVNNEMMNKNSSIKRDLSTKFALDQLAKKSAFDFKNFNHTPFVKGLSNLNNTCYLNAILQQLNNLNLFVEFIKNLCEENETFFTQKYPKSSSVVLNYYYLQENNLNDEKASNLELLKNFVLNFIKKQEHLAFVLGEQHDAIEFFYHFVYEIRNTCSELLEFNNMNENEVDGFAKIFYFELEQEIKCLECRQVSKSNFKDFSLRISDLTNRGLEQCILKSLSSETITDTQNMLECSKCRKPTSFTKSQTFKKLPQILIFHLIIMEIGVRFFVFIFKFYVK